MSWMSFLSFGSGFSMLSSGRDPSHLRSNSRASADGMMFDQTAQGEAVLGIIPVMESLCVFVLQTEGKKIIMNALSHEVRNLSAPGIESVVYIQPHHMAWVFSFGVREPVWTHGETVRDR